MAGARVLDVGCGVGTITLDVAAAVSPGEVTGIDAFAGDIDRARENSALVVHTGNVCFEIGDSHRLDFPDATFDVVYSHTALHFFLDPVRALREQKRVAKKGGWVIASGVRDQILSPRYPECPHWKKVWQAYDAYAQSLLSRFQSSGDDPVEHFDRNHGRDQTGAIYYNMRAGRHCAAWYSMVGFEDLRISVKAERAQYPGAENMEPSPWDLLVLEEPQDRFERVVALWIEKIVEAGFLDEGTLERAKEEVRRWYENPEAFNFNTLVFAAGRA